MGEYKSMRIQEELIDILVESRYYYMELLYVVNEAITLLLVIEYNYEKKPY